MIGSFVGVCAALFAGRGSSQGLSAVVAYLLIGGVVLRFLWRILRELFSALFLIIMILALFGLL